MADRPDELEDWEARFRVPRTLWARVSSHAPDHGLVASSVTGTYQLHRWLVASGALEPITDEPTGRTSGFLSPDGGWVVWHEDSGGGESGPWVTVPWSGGVVTEVAPDLEPTFSFAAAFSPAGSWFGAAILRGDTWWIVRVRWSAAGPGAVRVDDVGSGFVTDMAIDDDGTVAFAQTGDGGGLVTPVRAIEPDSTTTRYQIRHRGAVATLAFAPDRSGRLLGSTMQSGWRRPLIISADGTERRYDLPEIGGDLQPTAWASDGRSVILLGSIRSTTRLYLLDVETGVVRPLDHPAGAIAIGSIPPGAASYLPDGRILTTIEDGTSAPSVVALDPSTGSVHATLIAAPKGPRARPWRPMDIPSTDGALVQGWLATPPGPPPYPTIIEIHGGPEAQENDRYHPAMQAWLDRGYAVLLLNYRGSTGFGRDFESAIWGDPGRRELDDLVAARASLVESGIADPGAVVPTGGSYGGYLTLLALTARPTLWAAGVAAVAIADWRLMYEDGEALRGYQEALFGGGPDEVPERYALASPMTFAGQLQAPLLIFQGRNDPRCPPRQMEVFVEAARNAGRPLEIDWFDAGHGHGGAAERIAWQRRAMAFVDEALGRHE